MREKASAGRSIPFWCAYALWLILCGIITMLLVNMQVQSEERIGEIAHSSPAYWHVAITVVVCLLVWAGGMFLLVKAGKKSVLLLIVVWIIITILTGLIGVLFLSDFESAPHRAWHKYNDGKPIAGTTTPLEETAL